MQGEVRIAGWGEGRNQCEHGNTGGCVSEGKCKGDCRGESEGGGEGRGEGEGVVVRVRRGREGGRSSGVATSSIGERAWKSAGPELDETCRPSMATTAARAAPAAAGAVQAAGELAGGCGGARSGDARTGSDAMAQERSCRSVQLYQWKRSSAPVPDWW